MPRRISQLLASDVVESGKTASDQTVLLVDDEEGVRCFINDSLREWGYNTILARSGPEALRLSLFHKGSLELLLTDYRMPEMTGVELSNEIKLWRPAIKEIYITAYPADALTCFGLDIDVPVLQKPIRIERLKRTLEVLLQC